MCIFLLQLDSFDKKGIMKVNYNLIVQQMIQKEIHQRLKSDVRKHHTICLGYDE